MTDQTERPILDGRSFERLVRRVYCSFCGASDTEVKVMVTNGLDAHICDVCTGVVAQVVSTAMAAPGEAEHASWIESPNDRVQGPPKAVPLE